jgi:hypothetical protein
MTEEEIAETARRLLSKNPDWMAFNAGEQEKFRFVCDAQRLARYIDDVRKQKEGGK